MTGELKILGKVAKMYYYRLNCQDLYGSPPHQGCFQLTLCAVSDGQTGIPPVSCLTLTNGSPLINPFHTHPSRFGHHLFTLERKGLRSRRIPRNIVCVTPCGEFVFPQWRRRAATLLFGFFSRFKIVSAVFQATLSLSHPLSLSLFPLANWYSRPCSGESIR